MTALGGSPQGSHSQRAECVPQQTPTHPMGKSSQYGNPNEDNQEVTFLRGGWWGPREQPPHPSIPTQPDEDARHLINTLATRL